MRKKKKLPKLAENEYLSQKLDFRDSQAKKGHDDEIEDQGQFGGWIRDNLGRDSYFSLEHKGMDCPDCAMKATRAVHRLVALSHAGFQFQMVLWGLRIFPMSCFWVSSVLSSLGHDPDIGWLRVVGISPSSLFSRPG